MSTAPKTSQVNSSLKEHSETASFRWVALAIALVVLLPLGAFLASAVQDGIRREAEGPVIGVLGQTRFDELMAGEGGMPHYLGYERLAPDVTFTNIDGTPWRLSDQRGKVVVLNFWSITCPPCIEELPSIEFLAQISRERFGRDVEIVAVSTDSGWDAVSAVVAGAQRENPGASEVHYVFDSDKTGVEGAFGTELYPETWIIDAGGVIRMRYDGARDWSSPVTLDLLDVFL